MHGRLHLVDMGRGLQSDAPDTSNQWQLATQLGIRLEKAVARDMPWGLGVA